MAVGGVHRDVARLVEHQQILVLIEDAQRYVGWRQFCRLVRECDADALERMHAVDAAHWNAVARHGVGDVPQRRIQGIGNLRLPAKEGTELSVVIFRRDGERDDAHQLTCSMTDANVSETTCVILGLKEFVS